LLRLFACTTKPCTRPFSATWVLGGKEKDVTLVFPPENTKPLIDPIDDNVFVDQERVREICLGILDRKIPVQWRANCRFDYLSTYDKEFLGLLERAGFVELVNQLVDEGRYDILLKFTVDRRNELKARGMDTSEEDELISILEGKSKK
jgi:hypothetical protein